MFDGSKNGMTKPLSNPMQIIPAILQSHQQDIIDKLEQLSLAGYSGPVQIDLCDGEYVSNKTWPFTDYNNSQEFLKSIHIFEEQMPALQDQLGKFQIDLDLMVKYPEQLLSVWNMFNPERIIIHLDSIDDVEGLSISLSSEKTPFEFVRNKKVVFAISQTTDITLFDYWYNEFDCRSVQVMGIEHIGKQGEPFAEHTYQIIDDLQKRFPEIEIQVDGGVSIPVAHRLQEYGIAACVVGSSLFKDGKIIQNIKELSGVL